MLLLVVVGLVRLGGGSDDTKAVEPAEQGSRQARPASEVASTAPATPSRPADVPGTHAANGHIFGDGRFLVAYYGTGGTGALGVLGETDPATMHRRLLQAARPFEVPGKKVQPVYELIVTVADREPGKDGDYSHDISPRIVQQYVDAARRNGALLLLDLQPGRARFLDVARRWEWALSQPHVGLALDPEWRMGRNQVPGTVIGSMAASEVDLVAGWLDRFTGSRGLPEKLFVLHQFRTDMIRDIDRVQARPHLAMVQHVDGFGTPGQKLDTYGAVERADSFHMGFKLFYDEDVDRMSPRDVRRIKPAVRFVSFQ